MKYRPAGHRLLVKPVTQEEDVAVPEGLKKLGFNVKYGLEKGDDLRSLQGMDRGVIVEIGENAWMHQSFQGNKPIDQWKPWAKVGDKIFFIRHAGELVRDDNPESPEYWFIINDEDVKATIEE